MSAQDFLVELGTEELPPKALNTLADAFLAGIDKGLQAAGLNYESQNRLRRAASSGRADHRAVHRSSRIAASTSMARHVRRRSMPKATRPRRHWASPRSAAST